jgi:predicted SnoaL-like aldol condensation-catalyzing enzyme
MVNMIVFTDDSAAALRVLKGLQKEAERRGLELSVSTHDQLPTMVRGDSERFKQVMSYFTNNGFKNSSSVKIDINLVRTQGDTSVIGVSVEDSGPGMSEVQLDDTFQEFEQAQEEDWPLPAEEFTGSGSADLAVIARYVRKINGQILVSSELAKGTVFSVELPFEHASSDHKPRKLRNLFLPTPAPPKHLALPNHQPSPKSPARPRTMESHTLRRAASAAPSNKSDSPSPPRLNGGSVRGGGAYDHAVSQYGGSQYDTAQSSVSGRASTPPRLSILVAEDDPISLRMLDEKLSGLGHTVDIASNGQECHSQFASNQAKVDVILMDLEVCTPIFEKSQLLVLIRCREWMGSIRPT